MRTQLALTCLAIMLKINIETFRIKVSGFHACLKPEASKKINSPVIFQSEIHKQKQGHLFLQNRMKKTSPLDAFRIVLFIWLGLIPSCGGNRSSPAALNEGSPRLTANKQPSSAMNDQCAVMAAKIEEIEARILRAEQFAEQAQRRAKEMCSGDSLIDCNFWTSRAQTELRAVREIKQEQRQLLLERARRACD